MVDSTAAGRATAIQRRVLLIILDGLGFNLQTEDLILSRVIERLSPATANRLTEIAETAWKQASAEILPPAREDLLRLVLAPVFATVALLPAFDRFPWNVLRAVHALARQNIQDTTDGSCTPEMLVALITDEALAARYTIWYARSNYLNALRNTHPTVPTQAAGLAAGYEDVIPAVQGNSETGHQQIGNFIVAAQTPLEISTEIADGRFFQNPELLRALAEVKNRESTFNICFLLSGEYGNDGRVHSAWNHLEACLEAAFVQAKLPPARVRIQAITDGRDSPARSSVQRSGRQYGFLPKLRDLLARYGAEESLAWVVGRSIAMDRDYEETRSRQDFDLLVHGVGRRVADCDEAIRAVEEYHAAGITDTGIPPIVVGATVRVLGPNDVFLDLNFRADRQRAKIAMLLGAREFLEREAGKKGRRWDMTWMNPPAGLSVYCLSEYHPDLASKYGAHVLYPIRPQPHNLFAILPEQSVAQNFAFSYLLTAESTKALHVGYFIRGRREQPVVPAEEERCIIPSYGAEYGVATDDDYYKTPQMRAFSIADVVVDALVTRAHDLIAVNVSNTDMIGHLLPKRFDAADQSLSAVDLFLETVVPAAQRNGYHVVITADHGNIEDDDSSHTANEILTTFVSPGQELALRIDPRERGRLFDLPWSIVEIMGINDRIVPHIPPAPEKIREQGLVGRSLVQIPAGADRIEDVRR